MVVWIIGLSGSGKTTTAGSLKRLLEAKGKIVVHLDGDEIRDVWSDDLGDTIEERKRNHLRLSKLSRVLGKTQNIVVIVSALSIFPDLQKWNKENIEDYKLVFLNAGMKLLKERDVKHVYDEGNRNVVGKDIPFSEPYQPDLVIGEPELGMEPAKIAGKIASILSLSA
jgi:adenylylsulfate kinase-like enzyme